MSSILIVCGGGIVSGKEIMALELGRGLAKRGQTVSYITSAWNDGAFPQRLRESALEHYTLPIGFISATLTMRCLAMTFEQLWCWPKLLWGFGRLLRQERPRHVVHTNWHHLLLLLPLLRNRRDYFWLHECVPHLPQYRWAFNLIAQRVEAIICVSHATASALRDIGICDAKIRVVQNGLLAPAHCDASSPHNPDALRVGIVGQVNPWKGHDDLFEAIAKVAQAHPAVELHIFGKGNDAYRHSLERRAGRLSIATLTRWHDYVADRVDIYTAIDICVIPSRSQDPFPTTALEAGFFGLPTIATKRGGLPEIIEHEVNGLLVEPHNPAELAAAICRLIEEPELRARLGANARVRATTRFSQQRFLDDFESLLALSPTTTTTAAYVSL